MGKIIATPYQKEEWSSMKVGLLFIAFLTGLIYLGACAQTVERVGVQGVQGNVDPYFRPKRVYSVDAVQAWDLTLKVLNRQGVSLEMANRETGLIRTGYQNISAWERSQCDIRLSPEPRNKTFIYIRCRYEGRKEATEQFRDFTYSSPRETMKAEEEMYRRIEPYLLPFERILMPKEESAAKAPSEPDPSLTAATPLPKPEAVSPPAPSPPTEGQTRGTIASTPKTEPSYPKAEAGSPITPPAVVEVKPQPAADSLVKDAPTFQPEAPASPAPPISASPRKPEIVKEPMGPYLTTLEAANVRLAPSTQSKIITVLGKGKRVELVGESGPWTKIKLPSGDTAWIFTAFLKEYYPREGVSTAKPSPSRDLSSMPCPSCEKTPPLKPEMTSPTPTLKGGEVIKKKGVNGSPKMVTKVIAKMREEPSPKAKVALVLKKGREVEKIGQSGGFTKVKLSWGDTGWVWTGSLEKKPR